MTFQFTPYILPLALTALVTTGLSVLLWRRRAAPGAVPLALLLLAISEWVAAYCLELLGADLSTKHFWAQVQYFGIVALPLAWLHFTSCYPHREERKRHRPWLVALLLTVPVLTLVSVWIPAHHDLIWVEHHVEQSGPFLVLRTQWGIVFWIFVLYTYATLVYGSYLLLKKTFRSDPGYRSQTVAILVAVLVPWIGNGVYLFELSPLPGLDLSPFGFAVSGLALAWSILGQKMMDLAPIARNIVVENMLSAVIVLDDRQRIVDLNPSAVELFGGGSEEWFGKPATAFSVVWPELADAIPEVFPDECQGVVSRQLEGTTRWYDLHLSALRDEKGRAIGRLILLLDITTRRQERAALEELRQAVETSGEAIFMTDVDGLITYINPAFTRLYGYTAEEVVGKTTPRILKSGVHTQGQYEHFWQTLLSDTTVKGQLINRSRSGDLIIVEGSANPIHDARGKIVGFLAIQHDVTREAENQRKVEEAEARYRGLVEQLPIGRYGGEEFALVLPETDLQAALQAAERLRACVADAPISFAGSHLTITISVGVAALSEKTPDLSSLLNQADEAMLRAKRGGRNRVER
ncbi:MAG: PAS domain S-box protein [Chloroflexi bacterium]|nr:PAS domain S-box protein [Chloroflexota bacterium]